MQKKKTALDIQEEAKEQVEGLDSTSDTYKKSYRSFAGII